MTPAARPAQAQELQVFAAGSLRAALTEIASAYERAEPGQKLRLSFGASGLLKERIERMLDQRVRLGTSTPKADPSGDYAWQMFERVEQQGRPGAFRALSAKALQLTGGPQSPPPAGRSVYAMLVADGQADLFITYCTNAQAAVREAPALRALKLPAAIDVGASYGITILTHGAPAAARFVDFVTGPAGQEILARQGFAPG